MKNFVLTVVFISITTWMAGCGGGGHHGGGGGESNNVINLNGDIYIAGTSSGPNITFTDGTNASLVVFVDNIGNIPSDQLVTVTVGLPNGVTFLAYVSTTPGWTCTASGQTVTCTSSASIAGLSGNSTVTLNVSIASTATGPATLTASISTPDGMPSTHAGSKGVIFNPPAGPHISSLNPNSGPVGTAVTISGSNFGSSQDSSTVTFNGTKATTVTNWSASSIIVNVPAGTMTGNIVVTVGGTASNSVMFTVPTSSSAPTITGLNTTSGPVGTAVIISGSSFGSSQGTSTVTFNGTSSGNATSWSASSIVVNVPTGATTGNVVVTVAGSASNGVSFTVTTTSACASGGNAAGLLTGDYAFLEHGFGQPSLTFFVFAGRFHADGANTISKGLLEYNSASSGNSNGTPLSFTGCFVLNTPTNSSGPAVGTMSLVNPGAGLNYTFAISVQLDGNGRIINFDTNQNFRGSGFFQKQCPNAANATCPAFSDSNISGGYGMRFEGFTTTNSTANVAAAGRFTASGSGAVSGAVIDISTSGGVVALNDEFSGSYSVTDVTNGRVEITADVTYNNGSANGTAETFHFACYLTSLSNSGTATVLYCMTIDNPSVTLPLLSGRFIVQNTPSGGWTNANIAPASNASVIWSTGVTGSGHARVEIGQLTYNTTTNPPTIALSQDQNHGGSYSFQQATEDISITSNGRLQAIVSGSLLAVCYMLDYGEGVCVNEANNAALAFFVPQEAEPSGGFTTASFDNTFAFGTVDPVTDGVNDMDGVLASLGSVGTFTGPESVNSSGAGLSSASFSGAYSIASSSDAAIGRVTITATSPTADTLVLYIIDTNTAVAMSTIAMEPVVIYLNH